LFQTLATGNLEFVLEVDIGGCEEGVDTGTGGLLHSVPGSLNVLATTASQGRDYRAPNVTRYRLYRLKIAIGRDGKSSFDNVHPKAVELVGQALFL
jgi:hypothetical protein